MTVAMPYPWPIGTARFAELPIDLQLRITPILTINGYVPAWVPLHRTATEGPYIEFSGYKIRVTVETIDADKYIVRLV